MMSLDGSASDPPFRIVVREGVVVVVEDFSPRLRRWYAGLDRELPVVRDAVARLVADGQSRFVFDLSTADEGSAYPIAKWGAVYGALLPLRRREPTRPAESLARAIKLVGSGRLLAEIRAYHLDRLFEVVGTLTEAVAAAARGAV